MFVLSPHLDMGFFISSVTILRFQQLLRAFWESLTLLYPSHFLKIEFSVHWNMVLFDFNLWNLLAKRHFHPSRKGKAAPKILCANNKGNCCPHCTVTASRWCFAVIWLIWFPWMPLPCISSHKPFSISVTILDFIAFPGPGVFLNSLGSKSVLTWWIVHLLHIQEWMWRDLYFVYFSHFYCNGKAMPVSFSLRSSLQIGSCYYEVQIESYSKVMVVHQNPDIFWTWGKKL